MCCFLTVLVLLGPRFAAIVWWLFWPAKWNLAFSSIIWPILGIIFLPWTTLMYVILVPWTGNFWEWLFMILAVLADLASYGGGGWGNRDRLGM
ncbi:MAG: hypothetical protein JSV69_11325 [Chloroflexota bacterium]|nr:MAG: hypothetical protein JSV69_11325 [Chloroflexota bacterium]